MLYIEDFPVKLPINTYQFITVYDIMTSYHGQLS